jgi:hypothetical protein
MVLRESAALFRANWLYFAHFLLASKASHLAEQASKLLACESTTRTSMRLSFYLGSALAFSS